MSGKLHVATLVTNEGRIELMRSKRDVGCRAGRMWSTAWRLTVNQRQLENGGTVEGEQSIAAHKSLRTTKLYDRSNDSISIA